MVTRRIGFQQFFRTSPLVQRFLLPNARPTGRQLGVGSYGSVEEVKINGLTYAGKKLHETLLEAGNFGGENIVSKYSDECQLMSDLRHPNLVQFLGLCFLPASPLPLLVMERLSTSLDDLLESSPNIPLTMKRSILADVSCGLVYLHTHNPPVIHRDLSARNVLLNSAMVAKISDLGNSRIIDLHPGQLARTLSRLPGTMVYMPPEAFQETSRYGTKLDMFSFGHLGLFTVIQVFPSDLLPYTYPDLENPERIIGRSEVERRGAYFEQLQGQLGVRHPLERLIRGCLHNAPSLRPSAEEAFRQLEDMRFLLQDPYEAMDKLEMVRTLQEKDREIQQLQTQGQQPMPSADEQSRQQMEVLKQQIRQLQLAYSADLQTRDTELRERDTELQQKRAELRERDTELQQKRAELRERDTELQQKRAELRERDTELQERRAELRERDTELQQKNADVRRLRNELRTAQQQNSTHERTLASLRTDLQAREVLLREREGEAQVREAEMSRLLRELRSLQSQLHTLQEDAHQKDERLRQREVEIVSLQRQLDSGAPKVQSLPLPVQLRWKQCRNMPFRMNLPCSVVLTGKVYVGGGSASRDNQCTVMVYDLQSGRWDRLPRYRAACFGMAVVNSQLVLVGGVDRQTHNRINQLSVWDERSRQWNAELLPLLATPRSHSSVCTYNKWLVVAGGLVDDGYVKAVELLDTMTKQWYAAAPLPQTYCNMTTAVVGDTWHLLGEDSKITTKAFSVSLPDLISQATSQPQSRQRQANELWQELPDVPLYRSVALTLHGLLLAVGGEDDRLSFRFQSAIHLYQPDISKWVKVGDLPSGRCGCSCVSLPSGEFLVVGGDYLDRVDMGTVLD